MNAPPPRNDGELLSADAAARRLGVRKATLYAYVSRGLLRAIPDPAQPKASRYPAFEVERLQAAAHPARRLPVEPKAALYEGWPLVDTALTGVVGDAWVIRGQPLADLALTQSLEAVAALLWAVPESAAFDHPPPALPAVWHATAQALHMAEPASRAVALWGLAMPALDALDGAGAGGTGGTRPAADAQAEGGLALARALGAHLRVAAACHLGVPPQGIPLHEQVAQAWGLGPTAHDPLRQALVLCADVSVNLMALSGRMLASLQGSLAACLLATMSYGFVRLSGGEFEAVEALFDELQAAGPGGAAVADVAARRRERGEQLPGFHHELFPHGDPRAAALCARAQALGSPAGAWVQAMQPATTPLRPTLDWGLVALCRALGAPPRGAFTLMHLARSAGMLAQVLEQRQLPQRMWVRSRYVGEGA